MSLDQWELISNGNPNISPWCDIDCPSDSDYAVPAKEVSDRRCTELVETGQLVSAQEPNR